MSLPRASPIDHRRRCRVRAGSWLALVVFLGGTIALAPGFARLAAFLLLIGGLAAWHRWMWVPGAVPVLVYHSISSRSGWLPWADGISLLPEDFERQLAILRRKGCRVISTTAFLEARRSGGPLPERSVLIHIDDGYLDNWVAAVPLLKRFGFPATICVSLDFIEDGSEPRPTLDDVRRGRCAASDLPWEGYLNWAELQRLDSEDLIEIAAHGTDHGRVPVGPRIVGRLTPRNWRRSAWVQWAEMEGNKSGWFRHGQPPRVPYGSPILESRPALAAPRWSAAGAESQEQYETRVRGVLEICRRELSDRLDKEVKLFCWPQSASSPAGRRLAEEVGYWTTTAGRGENRQGEDLRVMSRAHVGDSALGWRWPRIDDAAFSATVSLRLGSYYHFLILAPMHLIRKLVLRWRRRHG